MNIISVSRRTDVPAFYMPWFVNRLQAGQVSYPNPFSGQLHTVSLRPDEVHSIVFWSKHYGPFLEHVDALEEMGYRFYCHYTITGAPRLLEPQVPDWEQAVKVLRRLSERTSSRQVQWRFDPILFTDELGADFYLQRFRDIASRLEGAAERCYFSFAAFYGKVERRLRTAGIGYLDPSSKQKQELSQALAEIAAEYGFSMHACCQDALVTGRVQKAHCVDGDLLVDLFPERKHVVQLRPTRDECGCMASRDIGVYDTCPFGCRYCYANQDDQRAVERFRAHDPHGEVLA